MMPLLITLVVVVAIVGQVSGVYVNIMPIHANEGQRGEGDFVVQINSNGMILSPYSATDRTQQFEKLDHPNSNKFFLYKYGDVTNRIGMLTTQTAGKYNVGAQPEKNSGAELLKQTYVLNGQKNQILCNGGERINYRLYTLQYIKDSSIESPQWIVCGSNQDEENEEFEIFSTREVTIKGNQFFLVNKQFQDSALVANNPKTPLSPSTFALLATPPDPPSHFAAQVDLLRGYSARTLWTFEGVVGSPGKYRIRSVAYPEYLLNAIASFTLKNHNLLPNDDVFYLEKVIDNPGDQWDYYRLMGDWSIPYYYGEPVKQVMINNSKMSQRQSEHNTNPDKELWRLIPRYAAKDEGYMQLHRERGNPTDVSITTSWEMGLVQTSSQEMSTTTGVEVSLEMAVASGVFSASLSSTVTHEMSQTMTSSSEQSWSSSTSITRTYPANKDCTLYQRKVSFQSLISADGLSQTPSDFKMVCVDE